MGQFNNNGVVAKMNTGSATLSIPIYLQFIKRKFKIHSLIIFKTIFWLNWTDEQQNLSFSLSLKWKNFNFGFAWFHLSYVFFQLTWSPISSIRICILSKLISFLYLINISNNIDFPIKGIVNCAKIYDWINCFSKFK